MHPLCSTVAGHPSCVIAFSRSVWMHKQALDVLLTAVQTPYAFRHLTRLSLWLGYDAIMLSEESCRRSSFKGLTDLKVSFHAPDHGHIFLNSPAAPIRTVLTARTIQTSSDLAILHIPHLYNISPWSTIDDAGPEPLPRHRPSSTLPHFRLERVCTMSLALRVSLRWKTPTRVRRHSFPRNQFLASPARADHKPRRQSIVPGLRRKRFGNGASLPCPAIGRSTALCSATSPGSRARARSLQNPRRRGLCSRPAIFAPSTRLVIHFLLSTRRGGGALEANFAELSYYLHSLPDAGQVLDPQHPIWQTEFGKDALEWYEKRDSQEEGALQEGLCSDGTTEDDSEDEVI